jgi:hypothetical protein
MSARSAGRGPELPWLRGLDDNAKVPQRTVHHRRPHHLLPLLTLLAM